MMTKYSVLFVALAMQTRTTSEHHWQIFSMERHTICCVWFRATRSLLFSTSMDNMVNNMKTLKQLPCNGVNESSYEGDGMTMAREQGKTPNGNEMNDKWVLRDSSGTMVDFDQYRSDLAERNDIWLESNLV